MSTLAFKVGDLVQLKSGGPPMVVTFTREGSPERIECGWFFDGRYAVAQFVIETLIPSKETQ